MATKKIKQIGYKDTMQKKNVDKITVLLDKYPKFGIGDMEIRKFLSDEVQKIGLDDDEISRIKRLVNTCKYNCNEYTEEKYYIILGSYFKNDQVFFNLILPRIHDRLEHSILGTLI